ncbi:hypothetical protein GTP44_01530 [Duganella sp. FT50W]|uniref:Uncharacterized protein n=1 Tax=Duganella lactea TaxID=2692173 RepID=A0A6L8MEQ0_9BURK|nr:hypothetical protein [Duganella lactea]MYM32924.1 hypothetical protein [Duganella lactea]MYM80641.1 hypothetical protein [Duganella lactea]
MEFAFTLRYRLPSQCRDDDQLAGQLAACDCADARVSVNRAGYLVLEFLRAADSPAAALSSAIADVQRALPSAELIDIRSDFMSN